ncbi:multisubunit potassium/proton antiporter, PhaD subunit [Devosia lucknowensis]|uniref:Multisubunit potassium/proton antiporter, PhaD subunit n=1 Tax=Devosia lucknowensis TaxID=1096929 RepID=A0A1Y6ERZ8_9HYPH|nr:monovalent cation/H+ antiporter subunit D [Devosia lucknowensis]SMQ63971.1 multisubunit potassium/proton antiporter, PhaD subunit [Devosia lucknowensis]
MTSIFDHLVILPILLPLATAVVLTLLDDRFRTAKVTIGLVSTAMLVGVAILLVVPTVHFGPSDSELIKTYALGDWPMPFGIVLVADRLSALMVLVTAILGMATLTFSVARWHNAGPNFPAILQILLMGLNGAFLTGDLFNLFVFFEVMLAASYGLLLHGSGTARVKAALHYIAVNLVASFLFLISAALIYGVTGTLNMADLIIRIPEVAAADRPLLNAGLGLLGLTFLIKAGMWPISFWLPGAYSVAVAPVAAMFAIMTKVGVYALLRLSYLLFAAEADGVIGFSHNVLFVGGIATLIYGTIGVMAAQTSMRLASYLVLVSSGTLLAAIGFGGAGVMAGALFYLVISTLAIGALFLLIEIIERSRIVGADVLAVTMEAFGDGEEEEQEPENEEAGLVIPASTAFLGISFGLCCLLLAGLPPLSGFLAKFAMLSTALGGNNNGPSVEAWWLMGTLIISGLAVLIAMARSGINIFWATLEPGPAQARISEMLPIVVMLALCIALSIVPTSVLEFMESTAALVSVPEYYVLEVMGSGATEGAFGGISP